MFTKTGECTKCLNLDSIPIVLLILERIQTPRYFLQSFRARFTLLLVSLSQIEIRGGLWTFFDRAEK